MERNKRKIAVRIVVLAAGIFLTGFILFGKKAGIQQGIAAEILRFHVIANSDSEEDQGLKQKVRDGVLDQMKELLSGEENLEETVVCLQEHMEEIRQRAEEILREEKVEDCVKAGITTCYFPVKSYGDCVFPAGNYRALRIVIGEGNGKNWWCVLYPNLCFLDSIHAVVPKEQKQELEQVLSEEEYESLFDWKESHFQITTKWFKW